MRILISSGSYFVFSILSTKSPYIIYANSACSALEIWNIKCIKDKTEIQGQHKHWLIGKEEKGGTH